MFARANAHHGLLRYADLRDADLGSAAIARRLDTHRLTRIHDGVYAFGHTALRPEARWLGASWTMNGAVLSHLSAAAYHEWLSPSVEDPVHVSTTSSHRSRDDIVVHRVRHLGPVDVMRTRHFPVTRIPRTLVDLADVMPWADYRALADRLPSLAVGKIREAQSRSPKRPGAPLVTRLVNADDAHTKSEFERRYLRFIRAHGIRRPDHLNHEVAGHKADAVYADERLVVELDGRGYHARRAQMRADRRRDADYQLAGYRILRFVWDDLHPDEAAATARRIGGFLAA